MAVTFFLGSMLPILMRGCIYSSVELSSPAPTPSSPRLPEPGPFAPPRDQTPSIKLGKVVEDPCHEGKRGVVESLVDNEKVVVTREGGKRKKPCNVKNLAVIPNVNNDYQVPTKKGDHVVVVGGVNASIKGKQGVVEKFNLSFCIVAIDGVTYKVGTTHLNCLSEAREVTVTAPEECFVVPLEAIEIVADDFNRWRSIKLIGNIRVSKFAAEV